MKRKLIAVPMYNLGDNSAGATKPYLEYLNKFGTVILLAPDAFVPEIDLLVLPGGKDIFNGNTEEFSFWNSDNERFLEWFDANTLPKYIKNGTAVYGICRGMQALVKHFNMPLVQNIWWDHGYSKDETDLKAHKIYYTDFCKAMVKGNSIHLPKEIESFHHQGLLEKNLDKENFELLAVSAEEHEDYKIVEFAMHKKLPIIMQQGHPERSLAALPEFLIKLLLNK
jgi:gamma-glutamyl-gamma-aminobutyrate hydrolase PuuD